MSSTARVKRPFAGASADPSQRQITSFFGAPQSGAAPHIAEPARQQPVLPANVQSNLLSVGMRIRKSVPEGYKTEGHSAFKLWTDTTTPNAPKVRPSVRVASRELLPFCGINKVGGLESQPAFRHDGDNNDEEEVPEEDAVPELTMSQETVDGGETATSSRKRIHEEEEDAQQLNGELSPGGRNNARPLAVPRSRMKKGAATYRGVGQENVKIDGDFEDAEFLVFDEEEDLRMVI